MTIPKPSGPSEEDHERNFLIVRAFLIAFRTSPNLRDCPLCNIAGTDDADKLREWVRRPSNLRKFSLLLRRSLSRLFFDRDLFHGIPCGDSATEQAEALPVILDACADSLRDVLAVLDFFPENFNPELVKKGESILSELVDLRGSVAEGFVPPKAEPRKRGRPRKKG